MLFGTSFTPFVSITPKPTVAGLLANAQLFSNIGAPIDGLRPVVHIPLNQVTYDGCTDSIRRTLKLGLRYLCFGND